MNLSDSSEPRLTLTERVLHRLSLEGARPWRAISVGRGDEDWNAWTDVHRRMVDVGGYKLHCIDAGKGHPVVMIHGYADSTYSWHRNARPLVDAGFRVILVDQPAMGFSEVPPAGHVYSMENQAAAVTRLLDRELKLDRYHVVGHSMGGGIALYLSLTGGKAARTAVVAPACYPPRRPPFFATRGIEYLNYAFGGRWVIRAALWDLLGRKNRVEESRVDEYARPLNKPGYTKVLALLGRQYFSDAYRSMSTRYGELTTPLLILWGDRDTWAPPKWGPRLNAQVPGSLLNVVPGAGHLVHQQEAEVVNAHLVKFLRS